MTEILYVKNRLLLDQNVDLIQFPQIHPPHRADDGIPFYSSVINSLDQVSSVLYSTNNIVLKLEMVEPDQDFTVFLTNVSEIYAYFKYQNIETDTSRCFGNFIVKPLMGSIISSNGFSMELKLSDNSLNDLRNFFEAAGIAIPQYGILQFTVRFSDDSFQTYACKFTTRPIFSTFAPSVSESINTYTTPGHTFESLFIPQLSSSFVYNFYETNEDNEEIFKLKNYSGFPLNEIPKFVKLQWTKVPSLPSESEGSTIRVDGITLTEPEITPSTIPESIPSGPRGSLFDRFHIEPTGSAGSAVPSGSVDLIIPTTPEIPTMIPFISILNSTKTGYVGYVILKEKLEQDTGEFILNDILAVRNPNQIELIDWKIAYGEVYRYRIKSLFRFVDRDNISIYEDSDSLLNRQQQIDVFGVSRINSYLYFFDSEFSLEQTVYCVDVVRPDAPTQVCIFPNSKDKNILITWNQKNQNLDVIGFNVYKKPFNSKEPFKKCNLEQLNIRNNYYIDYNIELEKEYIYAIESIDVHGNFSKLSIQLIAKISNFDIDLGRNEEKPLFYAFSGLELNDERPVYKNTDYTYFKDKFVIKINPFFNEMATNKKFILRILSLDTLIMKEIKMKFKLSSIYIKRPRNVVSDVGSVVGPNIVGGRDISTISILEEGVGGIGGIGGAIGDGAIQILT